VLSIILYCVLLLYIDDAKTMSEALPGIDLSNTTDASVSQLLPQETKTVTADSRQPEVSSVNEQFEKPAADVKDDIVENSSPLQRDEDASFVVPVTTVAAAAACNSAPVPPALLSLPSLTQLCRQALDCRAERFRLSAGDQRHSNGEVSCSSAIEDMFSEDDSFAEMTQVI